MPEFEANGPITAVIRASSGSVNLVAEERNNVEVEIRPDSSSEAARAAAAETRAEMNGDLLLIETPQSKGFVFRRGGAVAITVRMPLDSRLEVTTASSDVQCVGRYSTAEVKTASGDLRIDHVTGDLNRNSASGDTQFGRVDGDFSSHSASGDVRGGVIGGNMTSRSASGDTIVDTVGGSVKAQSASGDIRVGSVAAGTARLTTVSGDVEICVAEGTSVWLDLSSVSGATVSDLNVSDAAPAGGTATLTLHARAVSGDISVRRAVAATR
jgi:putative adhesin